MEYIKGRNKNTIKIKAKGKIKIYAFMLSLTPFFIIKKGEPVLPLLIHYFTTMNLDTPASLSSTRYIPGGRLNFTTLLPLTFTVSS